MYVLPSTWPGQDDLSLLDHVQKIIYRLIGIGAHLVPVMIFGSEASASWYITMNSIVLASFAFYHQLIQKWFRVVIFTRLIFYIIFLVGYRFIVFVT